MPESPDPPDDDVLEAVPEEPAGFDDGGPDRDNDDVAARAPADSDALRLVAAREVAEDEEEDVDDEEALVPLGDVLQALDRERQAAAQETASDLLRRTRTPPHAMDAERAVLGALLLEPSSYEAVVDEGLRPEHFYRPHHGTIFKVIADLHAKAEPIDTLTVVDELLRNGQLDAVGGAAAISQLEALLPTAAHVGAYARLVRDKAVLRLLIENATNVVQSAYAQDKSVAAILDEAEQKILEISQGNSRKAIVPMREQIGRAHV